MSVLALHGLVGRAVISDKYRVGILNGHKADLIREANLDPDEVAEVMAIGAKSLAEFAAAIDRIARSREPVRPRVEDFWHGSTLYSASR